jgi:alkylated DNA nucleotide flippase Atl1
VAVEPTVFAQRVLEAVESIPAGAVMSYGDVAEYVGAGGARAVGTVLARWGGGVPWHRVVRADGSCATHKADQQLARLRAEGVPVRNGRVVMALARWDGTVSNGPVSNGPVSNGPVSNGPVFDGPVSEPAG